MNLKSIGATLALLALVGGTGSAWWLRRGSAYPELASSPAPAIGLLFARPFVLDQAYVHEWRAERPRVRAGWILVLEVDPLLAHPREAANKVLYVGDQTAERINHGSESGRIVVLVPEVGNEVEQAPIWFGRPALPEQIDAAAVADERVRAEQAGARPFDAGQWEEARRGADAPLALADRFNLDRELAGLIRRYSDEAVDLDIARGLELPLAR